MINYHIFLQNSSKQPLDKKSISPNSTVNTKHRISNQRKTFDKIEQPPKPPSFQNKVGIFLIFTS